MIVFGIDPGFSGAIAELDTESRALHIHDMPTLPGAKGKVELCCHSVLDLLEGYEEPGRSVAWIEKVGARPGQGVSSMFRFGQQLGALEMAAAAKGHEVRWVTPASWKKHFGLSADKGAARKVAMERFPAQAKLFARVKDDGRAEAALIALYGAEQGNS
jgi:crossover junction endodeoxyribonuclease RuvC